MRPASDDDVLDVGLGRVDRFVVASPRNIGRSTASRSIQRLVSHRLLTSDAKPEQHGLSVSLKVIAQ